MEIIQKITTIVKNRSFRKVIGLTVILLLACLVAYLSLYFWRTGEIIVEANDAQDIITVSDTREKHNDIVVKEGRGKLSGRLKPGNYYIKVSNEASSKTKYISVIARRTIRLKITPEKSNLAEPVLFSGESFSIAANNNRLVYLSNGGSLKTINPDNETSLLTTKSFKSIKWADVNYGIAKDENGSLFTIIDGAFSQLSLPDNITFASYSISISKDRQAYLWTDDAAYKLNDKKFNKIFTKTGKQITNLLPSNTSVVIITSDSSKEQLDDKKSLITPEQEYTINVLDSSGEIITKEEELYDAAISKNGDFIAITSDKSTEVFSNKLQDALVLPDTNVNSMTWLNDSELIYSVANKIQVFDVSSRESYTLTNSPYGNGVIPYLTLSDNSEYVYFISGKNTDELMMSRVSFAHNEVPSYIYNVQYILPKTFLDCSLQLINFTKPTILMSYSPADLGPYCRFKTTEYLSQNGLNPNDYNYSTNVGSDD